MKLVYAEIVDVEVEDGMRFGNVTVQGTAKVGMLLNEYSDPISEEVKGACEILGLDPLYVANEGKLLAISAAEDADRVLEVLRSNSLGRDAAVIGEVVNEHPGLIITDLVMPEQEGLETIRQVRKHHPKIPIIAISGGGRNSSTDYLLLARKLGAAGTLAKPFSRDELVAAMAAAKPKAEG